VQTPFSGAVEREGAVGHLDDEAQVLG